MNSGRFTGQTDYSAFGEVIGGNNPGASQSVYQWGAQSGYRMDGGSGGGGDCGLVKVGARYYDPAVGRFTSRDSDMSSELVSIPAIAGLLDDVPALGHNAYVYCGGDPINCTDPSGHSYQDSPTNNTDQGQAHQQASENLSSVLDNTDQDIWGENPKSLPPPTGTYTFVVDTEDGVTTSGTIGANGNLGLDQSGGQFGFSFDNSTRYNIFTDKVGETSSITYTSPGNQGGSVTVSGSGQSPMVTVKWFDRW